MSWQNARTCMRSRFHTKYQCNTLSLFIPLGPASLLSFRQLLYYFFSRLPPSSFIPRPARRLSTLGIPDMISMKPCSSGHALPCPIPAPPLFKLLSHVGHCQVSSELNGALSCVAQHSGRENSFFTGGTTSISGAKHGLFH